MRRHWALYFWNAAINFFVKPPRPPASENLEAVGRHHPLNFAKSKFLVNRNSTDCACKPEPKSRYLNSATEKFAVNGTGIPEVDFDVGESYSGILPISNKTDERDHMFFWFFPTANEERKQDKEITIWLNGGPGCSSLIGLLLENGPFLWRPGTLQPQRNPWSWHHLTNVVWIEQPVGVGFSEGEPSITNEDELAVQFMGFWRNFVELFDLHEWRVYIATESYGGYYGPYISSHFIDSNDTDYYNLAGLMVYDGLITDPNVHFGVCSLPYISRHQDAFALDDNAMSLVRSISDECGYTEYYERYLKFPPSGIQPSIFPGTNLLPNGTSVTNFTCGNLSTIATDKAAIANPCFNVYNIPDHCPMVYNPVTDAHPYFDRADVKKAIHAPASINWEACVNPVFNTTKGRDTSSPSGLKQLPHVIEATQNVILAHGDVDWLIPVDSVLLGIQNMTWGGKMGFQCKPQDPFYVPLYGFNGSEPAHMDYAGNMSAGAGVQGTVHEERGLTFVVTKLAGHQGPAYAPAASVRHLEKLLGRVDSLSGTEPFTLPALRNITQLQKPLGRGIVHIPEGTDT
ncbi:alpha/beta-hydrolase [Trichoderma barbatum]